MWDVLIDLRSTVLKEEEKGETNSGSLEKKRRTFGERRGAFLSKYRSILGPSLILFVASIEALRL